MAARLAKPVERDWTKETLVLDLVNANGDKFHFETEPDEEDNLPVRASDAPGPKGKTIVNLIMPL